MVKLDIFFQGFTPRPKKHRSIALKTIHFLVPNFDVLHIHVMNDGLDSALWFATHPTDYWNNKNWLIHPLRWQFAVKVHHSPPPAPSAPSAQELGRKSVRELQQLCGEHRLKKTVADSNAQLPSSSWGKIIGAQLTKDIKSCDHQIALFWQPGIFNSIERLKGYHFQQKRNWYLESFWYTGEMSRGKAPPGPGLEHSQDESQMLAYSWIRSQLQSTVSAGRLGPTPSGNQRRSPARAARARDCFCAVSRPGLAGAEHTEEEDQVANSMSFYWSNIEPE